MSKVVALEIAPQAIRAAEVAGYRTKKPKLLRVGEIKLEEGVAAESMVQDGQLVSEALKQLWKESKFSTRSAALVVSGRRFIVRNHTTGHTNLSVLKRVLHLEAPNAFPDQNAEILFDFYPTHGVETKAGMKTEGLVISSPSEPISELAFAVNRAGLDLEYVDFAPLAITRWILRNRPEQRYAVVNIREESTDIAVADGGMPRMVRVLSKGMSSQRRRFESVTTESSQSRGLSASPLLRRDVLGENAVKLLVQDISLTVNTQAADIEGGLECIFTTGPRAADPELQAVIGDIFNIPVVPLSISSIPLEDDEENNRMPSFDNFVAMAGGMR